MRPDRRRPTILDDLGDPVALGRAPHRIVSLVPSLTETLWWWHLGDAVVGATEWCVAPPHGFPNATRVRGTKNPDTAAIVALEPDVVVANREENRELDVRRLREAGVSVYVTAPASVEQAARSLAGLGEALGVGGAGAALAQEIRRAVARVGAARADLTAFVPIWREPWMSVGTGTIAGDLLRLAGFTVVPDAPRYPSVELDEVAALGVDVVLLPDEPYAFTDDHRADFAGWAARVRRIDGTALTWWGPRTPSSLVGFARLATHLRRRGRRAGGYR